MCPHRPHSSELGRAKPHAVMKEIRRVVIVGAGQAGGETARRLREGGFSGEIVLLGEEPCPPYQRPPLSKQFLSGTLPLDRLLLRPPEAYVRENIARFESTRADQIDRRDRRVCLADGSELSYDALVLATGSKPRTLPLGRGDLAGVHVLRTVADVNAIRPGFVSGAKLVIVGAGYIGLEVAAVAREAGLDVTVVEGAARPLERVTSAELASFFLTEHASKGVRFIFDARCAVINGDERVRSVGLQDGREIAADLVIVGIGVTPDVSLAEKCDLQVGNGIVTDRQCRTSDPLIFAVGDCASRPLVHFGGRMERLESVHNAIESARIAAAVISGATSPVEEPPWFWSDQYDLKLQIAGLFAGYDRTILRGRMADRSFAMFYYRGERLIAVDAVNKPSEFLGTKMLIAMGLSIPPETVADESRPMKELVAKAQENSSRGHD